MERRDGLAILLDVDAVLEGVRGRNLAGGELGGHGGGGLCCCREMSRELG